MLWNFKKALRVKEISIENAVDQRSSMVMVSLKPEPIPLDLKVLLIGNNSIYQTLLAMDSDFKSFSKSKLSLKMMHLLLKKMLINLHLLYMVSVNMKSYHL